MRLKRAGSGDSDRVSQEFLDFWSAHGAPHFRIEEEILLPAYARHADPTAEAIVRVLTDHVRIRERVDSIRAAGGLSVTELNELGELLDSHVRHEERVLFPLIEAALPRDELAELAAAIEAAER